MEKVNSLEEAKTWFLANASGSVVAVKGDTEKEVASFAEAEAFYGEAEAEVEAEAPVAEEDAPEVEA